MGCGESKIKNINLPPDPAAEIVPHGVSTIEMTKTIQDTPPNQVPSSGSGLKLTEDDGAPNRLLSAIPISDLGESLDSRHLSESFNGLSHGKFPPNGIPDKNGSLDSHDSGYDEYDEENNHIITEHSEQELVRKVESEFRGVDLPELLVITGRACTRILSGYQKNKAEEVKILESLRDEGLLAKPKGKTAGGVSFEVVDAAIIDKNISNAEDSQKDAFISAEFIPSKTLKKLESRRGVSKLAYKAYFTSFLFALLYLSSDSTIVRKQNLAARVMLLKKGFQIASFLSLLKRDDMIWNPAT